MSASRPDIVVVGAGAAGCLLGRRAAEAGATVLLLEAGPDLRRDVSAELRDGWRLPVIPDWGYESEATAERPATKLRRGRLVGGTSWLTRFAVRGAAADFDGWAASGNEGWAFADVLPAFRELEQDVDYGDREWHGSTGRLPVTRYLDLPRSDVHRAAISVLHGMGFQAVDDLNRPDPVGVGPMPMNSRAGVRVTSMDAFLPPEDMPTALSLRASTLVASVDIHDGRAAGVTLADGERLAAGEVMLAAGTYGSPVILLRSGIGPARHLRDLGIEVRVDLPGVGENLADHPGVEFDVGWQGQTADGPSLHSLATFRSSHAGPSDPPDLMFWLTDPGAADPGFYLDPILLRPRSRGSVRLSAADPAAPPRIRLPALDDAADVDRLAEGYRVALEVSNAPELRALCAGEPPDELREDVALRHRLVENAYSIPHVVGTCRMGSSPADGAVVDAAGYVHGVVGLSVVDASIIPEPPSGFPHLITLMIAQHLMSRRNRGGASA